MGQVVIIYIIMKATSAGLHDVFSSITIVADIGTIKISYILYTNMANKRKKRMDGLLHEDS